MVILLIRNFALFYFASFADILPALPVLRPQFSRSGPSLLGAVFAVSKQALIKAVFFNFSNLYPGYVFMFWIDQ